MAAEGMEGAAPAAAPPLTDLDLTADSKQLRTLTAVNPLQIPRRDSSATGAANPPPSPPPFFSMSAVFEYPMRMLNGSVEEEEEPVVEITQAEYNNFLRMFKTFDEDGSGTIDMDELGHIMLCLGVPMGEEDLRELVGDATDADGEIGFSDFVELMCRHKERLMAKNKRLSDDSSQYIELAMHCDHLLPDSPSRWLLDVFMFIAVFYYTFVVGIGFVEHPVLPGHTELILEIVFHVIFYLDIATRMRTLPTVVDETIQRPERMPKEQVAKLYLAGDFFWDALSSLPIELALSGTPALALRTAKLLKVLRVHKFFDSSNGRRMMTARYVIFVYSVVPILKLVFWLCMTTHWFCVGWILLEHECDNLVAAERLSTRSVSVKYLEALYMVLYTLTTVGYGNVGVFTDRQRLFCCVLFIVGAVINGFVISEVNNRLSRSDITSERKAKMVEMVGILRFFRIPRHIQREILSFQHHTLEQNLSSAYSEIITALPKNMQDQLSLYVKLKFVSRVPFFMQVHEECKVALAYSLENIVVQPNEFIICAGEVGEEMYFLGHGVAEVLAATGKHISTLRKGDFFGEIALLFARDGNSKRTASVRALMYCDLFQLSKVNFLSILARFPRFRQVVDKEATLRRSALNPGRDPERSPPSSTNSSWSAVRDAGQQGSPLSRHSDHTFGADLTEETPGSALELSSVPTPGFTRRSRQSLSRRSSDSAAWVPSSGTPKEVTLSRKNSDRTCRRGSLHSIAELTAMHAAGGMPMDIIPAVQPLTRREGARLSEQCPGSPRGRSSPAFDQVSAGRDGIADGSDVSRRIERLERLFGDQQVMMEQRFAKLEEMLTGLGTSATSSTPAED